MFLLLDCNVLNKDIMLLEIVNGINPPIVNCPTFRGTILIMVQNLPLSRFSSPFPAFNCSFGHYFLTRFDNFHLFYKICKNVSFYKPKVPLFSWSLSCFLLQAGWYIGMRWLWDLDLVIFAVTATDRQTDRITFKLPL